MMGHHKWLGVWGRNTHGIINLLSGHWIASGHHTTCLVQIQISRGRQVMVGCRGGLRKGSKGLAKLKVAAGCCFSCEYLLRTLLSMLLNITDGNVFNILKWSRGIRPLVLQCICHSSLAIMNAVSSGLTFIDRILSSKNTSHHQCTLYTRVALGIICLLVGRAVIIAASNWRFDTKNLWRLLCHCLIRDWIMLREVDVRQVLTECSSCHVSSARGNSCSKRAVLLRAIVNHTVWGWGLVKVDCALVLWRGMLGFLFLMMVR